MGHIVHVVGAYNTCCWDISYLLLGHIVHVIGAYSTCYWGHIVTQNADTNERREGVNIIHNTKLFVDPYQRENTLFFFTKVISQINSVVEKSSKFVLETNKLYPQLTPQHLELNLMTALNKT